ncbi:MAG TPA: winged helix-turn-helix domain-containing protein, partial [Burkholderiales bacterium]|nr:winged helix-turn-helix domain-containing protein [Burkholderiales bacterium]
RVTMKTLVVGELTLDPHSLAVSFRQTAVKLTPKCLRLLETLMLEPGRVLSRKQLENAVWGDSLETSDTLRTHMHVLRRALVEAGGYDPIETVHGLGYRLAANAPAQT